MAFSMGSSLPTDLPELVRDSRLETIPSDDTTVHNTVHIYYDRPGRRAEPRRETWKEERIIGSGGNGVVRLEKRVVPNPDEKSPAQYRAVKQITLAKSTPVLKVCMFELEALAKFSMRKYRRCFVESFGWYESAGFLSIAMEYCPLGDLQRYLIEHTRLRESDSRDIVGQIVEGLKFMHDEGFAHRDLKPGNILIKSCPPGDDWWVKICDMGLSKRIQGAGAGTTAVKGTHGFFAPEQLGLGGVDPKKADPFKTDIWCLGEIAFRMLCGEAVFPSYNDLRGYHRGTVRFPKERLHEIGASSLAVAFIMSAMLVEPQSRLETHQALNHEWLEMSPDNDLTAGHTIPSDPVLPNKVPKRDMYLGTEPSAAWSTGSLPSRPSSRDEHQDNKTALGPSLSHDITGCGGDEATLKPPQTVFHTPINPENELINGIDNRSDSPRPRSTTDYRDRTSRHNECPSTRRRNSKESVSPIPTTIAATGEQALCITEVGDTEKHSRSEHSIEPQMKDITEAKERLSDLENDFVNKVQHESLWYFQGYPQHFMLRKAEYKRLVNTAMSTIVDVDEIESLGNEEIRSRRKALIDRVNALIDELHSAQTQFDTDRERLSDLENDFINSVRHQSLWYFQGYPQPFMLRKAEYKRLVDTATSTIEDVDEIKSVGNEEIQSRRKALTDQANALIKELHSAQARFDKEEKELLGAESSREGAVNPHSSLSQHPPV